MKFAVYTKWYWENGVPTLAELQANMNKASVETPQLKTSSGGKSMRTIINL
ncbi:MAG: hypothetical protein HN867_11855 [Deltaproteobacteria bacterium]|jgi:hypothetical protein|nr:hypothetical protein [Deltaproteobacteria bacterium]MBT7204159.1 hypothetical protein [Deltaproteobacteria bacterium]